MWNFDIRPKPKHSAKNRSIRPNIRPNISILINQVFEHLTKNFSRHNFTLTFLCIRIIFFLGSLSCPLHSEIRYYIFGSDRDMGFNPRKKIALSISMTFGIQGESLCLCFEYYSPVLSLASLELLSLKTTLLSWHLWHWDLRGFVKKFPRF